MRIVEFEEYVFVLNKITFVAKSDPTEFNTTCTYDLIINGYRVSFGSKSKRDEAFQKIRDKLIQGSERDMV